MMRRMVRPVRWRPVVIVLALCVAIFAATRPQSRLTIAIHQGVEGVALKRVAESFSQKRNVVVEIRELSYDDLFDEEIQNVKAPEPPFAVMMLDDPWLPALLDPEWNATERKPEPGWKGLEGKKGLWAEDGNGESCTVKLADFFAPTLNVGRDLADSNPVTCASTLYALPFVGNTQLFAIPKGLEPPTTWTEVEQRGSGYVMRAGPGNSIVTDFMPILWNTDAKSFRTKDSLRLESSEAVSFVGALGRAPNAMRAVVATDDFDLAIYLAKRQASMGIVWSAWAMAMAKLPDPTPVEQLTLTQVPGGEHALGAWLLAIPSNATNRDKTLAADFVRFATEPEQLEAAALLGNPPPRRNALKSLWSESKFSHDFQRSFLDVQPGALDTARPRPRTPRWRAVEKALGSCLSARYENAITDKEAVDRANAAIVAILKDQHPPADCWLDTVRASQVPSPSTR